MNDEFRHQCLIYDGSPSHQLPALAAMIEQKMREGYRCLYLNSRPMVAGMISTLAARGIDVINEVAKARLVLSSDPVTSDNGDFDIDLMIQNLESILDQALIDGHKGLWASGDMSWELGSVENFTKLMEYEIRLEKLFWKRQELGGICQYHRGTLPPGEPRKALLTHPGVFINETLSRLNPYYILSGANDDPEMTAAEWDETISVICNFQNKPWRE